MKTPDIICTRLYESPCGTMILGSFGDRLCLCNWLGNRANDRTDRRVKHLLKASFQKASSEVIDTSMLQLDEYFSGQRKTFDIPLIFAGSEFQKSVWNELLTIPYGTTVSYKYISQNISNPKAVRAVANAIGANPISIIVPCHRVLGSDNTLTGYAGGLLTKKSLLQLEGIEDIHI